MIELTPWEVAGLSLVIMILGFFIGMFLMAILAAGGRADDLHERVMRNEMEDSFNPEAPFSEGTATLTRKDSEGVTSNLYTHENPIL